MTNHRLQARDLLLVMLRLLERQPLADGDILVELDRHHGAQYCWTPNDVFVALDALESESLVAVETRDVSVVYRVTPGGVEAIERRRDVVVVGRKARWPRERRGSGVVMAQERATVLFTDVVGSTELFERLGDDAAHQLRRRHFALLRRVLGDFGGWEVKSLGDGLMVAFGDAGAAVACAGAMQHAVAAGEDLVQLRIGVASGEVIREDDDYFGRPVIVARRLCDAASGGETLICEDARGLVAHTDPQAFKSCGPLRLKGLRVPVAASAMRMQPLTLSA